MEFDFKDRIDKTKNVNNLLLWKGRVHIPFTYMNWHKQKEIIFTQRKN